MTVLIGWSESALRRHRLQGILVVCRSGVDTLRRAVHERAVSGPGQFKPRETSSKFSPGPGESRSGRNSLSLSLSLYDAGRLSCSWLVVSRRMDAWQFIKSATCEPPFPGKLRETAAGYLTQILDCSFLLIAPFFFFFFTVKFEHHSLDNVGQIYFIQEKLHGRTLNGLCDHVAEEKLIGSD